MIVVKEGPYSFGAYVPDLPGCIAVGETRYKAIRLIREAIEFHIEGLINRGDPVPQPFSRLEFSGADYLH